MSKESWKRDPRTGLPVSVFDRCDLRYVDDRGQFDVARYPDCNVFNVASLAARAGFRDPRHFRDKVLLHSQSPFHVHRIEVRDDMDGRYLATVFATHANSAEAGGKMWQAMKREEARSRATISPASSATSTSRSLPESSAQSHTANAGCGVKRA